MISKETVLAVFSASDEPLKAGEVATKLGVDTAEVDKIMKQLKAENAIISPKRCYWTTPGK